MLNVNELMKGIVKICVINGEDAVAINNDSGVGMQCFRNRAAQTIRTGAHLTGNDPEQPGSARPGFGGWARYYKSAVLEGHAQEQYETEMAGYETKLGRSKSQTNTLQAH